MAGEFEPNDSRNVTGTACTPDGRWTGQSGEPPLAGGQSPQQPEQGQQNQAEQGQAGQQNQGWASEDQARSQQGGGGMSGGGLSEGQGGDQGGIGGDDDMADDEELDDEDELDEDDEEMAGENPARTGQSGGAGALSNEAEGESGSQSGASGNTFTGQSGGQAGSSGAALGQSSESGWPGQDPRTGAVNSDESGEGSFGSNGS